MNSVWIRLLAIAASMVTATTTVQADNLKDATITNQFPLQRCLDALASQDSCMGAGCNAYLPLEIGRVWTLDNLGSGDREEDEAVIVSVLAETEVIDFDSTQISTRVYEERESVDGEETEVSRNFLTQCGDTQDVYYWGEEVCVPEGSDAADEDPPFDYVCEEGLVPGGGAWKAGVDGAEPGILFPGGAFLLGARYLQELAVNAQDWGEHAETGLTADDPANGEFHDCVLVIDRNLLEDPKGKEGDEKVYCPEIGIVQDEDLVLTSCTTGGGANCSQP